MGAGIAGDENGDSCGEQYKWTPGVSDEEPCEGAFVDGASEGGIAFSSSLVLSTPLDISLSPALFGGAIRTAARPHGDARA